jgi:RNA polymerase sigma factor (sigma-70 family)
VRKRRKNVQGGEAAKQLADANVRLVYHVANNMAQNHDREADDMVGYGYMGLRRAAELFEPERGLAFSTYAVPRIRGAILDGLRKEQPWAVRLEKDRLVLERYQRSVACQEHAPGDRETCEALGWTLERLTAVRRCTKPVSLSQELLEAL